MNDRAVAGVVGLPVIVDVHDKGNNAMLALLFPRVASVLGRAAGEGPPLLFVGPLHGARSDRSKRFIQNVAE